MHNKKNSGKCSKAVDPFRMPLFNSGANSAQQVPAQPASERQAQLR